MSALKINRGTEAKETLVLFAASGMDYLTHISGSHVGTGLGSCRMSSLALHFLHLLLWFVPG